MGSLGNLTVNLTANWARFQSDMGRAARIAEVNMASIERTIKKTSGIITASMVAAAAGFSVKMKQITDDADNLAKTSRKIGIATEELSALRYSADLAGVSFDEVTSGLVRLSRNASDAANGLSAPKRAFDYLGVSIKNSDGSLRDINSLILDIADKFSKMEDGTRKAALAQELLGRAGANLIPLLNEGRDGLAGQADEAERLGIIIDTQTALAAEQFNDNMTRLKGTLQGISIRIANDIIPVLTVYSDQMAEAALSQQKFNKVAESSRDNILPSLRELLAALIDDVDGFVTALNMFGKSASLSFNIITMSAQGKFKEIPAMILETVDAFKKLDDQFAKRSEERWNPQQQSGMSKLTQQMLEEADAREKQNKLIDEGIKLREQMRTPSEVLIDTQEHLNDLIMSGAIDLETYNRAAAKAIETYDKQTTVIPKVNDLMRDMGATFTSAAEEAVMSGEKISNVLTGLLEDIERILLRKALLEPFFNSIFGDSGILSGLMSGVGGSAGTASARGNVFSSGRLLAFSSGGIVNNRIQFPMANGAVGIAGEAGPEAIMPLKRTSSGRLGVDATGGGNVEVNVYAPEGSTVQQSRQNEGGVERINIIIDEAVASNVSRQGSKTYRAMRGTFGLGQRLTTRGG